MEENLESQDSTCCGKSSSTELKFDIDAKPPNSVQKSSGRTDRGRAHAMRDSLLSRRLLETLTHYGENLRTLRRLEAGYRSDLRPKGPLGRLFFDRFWLCILRLILLGHLEARGLTPRKNSLKEPMATPSLSEGFMPVLVTGEEPENSSAISADVEALEPDLFHRLVLIGRYDRSVSREMFRYLSLLILMRDGGEKGLARAIGQSPGSRRERTASHA